MVTARRRIMGILPRSWFYRGSRATPLGRATSRFLAGWASLGLPTGRQVGLEVTGRRTGSPHVLAVVLAWHEGQDYLVSMVGEGEWVKNVRASGGAAVLIDAERRQVHLEEVPVDRRAPIIQAYVRVAPGGRRHMGLGPHATLGDCERVAPNFPVFRVVYRSHAPSGRRRYRSDNRRDGTHPPTLLIQGKDDVIAPVRHASHNLRRQAP